jgi:hypothetical protein
MAKRQYYELIVYHLTNRAGSAILDAYLEHAALPAYARLGIGPVGVFRGVYGPASASVYLLLPHPNIESFASTRDRLLSDQDYIGAGSVFLDASIDNPSYARCESTLMAAFSGMPRVELPENHLERPSRIFELRTYESHSLIAHKKKIEMFNEGGEIDIFRRTGLSPVFFGETLTGQCMPNLTYMLTFENMDRRNEVWECFKADSEWHALRDNPKYSDTVSNITDYILEPLGYSQM